MQPQPPLGNIYRVGDLDLTRMGYGAMQLPGPGVFGPPADHAAAVTLLREVFELGVRHIDTADFYGPHVANDLIREALHPYPNDLHIVTKVGGRRDSQGGWLPALSPTELRSAVHDNLRRLGVDVLDVVNLRIGGFDAPGPGSLTEQFETLAELQRQGLVRHLGVSNVTAQQVAEAQTIATVVCVQNNYNLTHRGDDPLIDALAAQGIGYVPYFPLGGFSPLQSRALQAVADELGQAAMTVALAWLLRRSPNVLLIPGTSSLAHLRQNVAAGSLQLPDEAAEKLNAISD